MLGTSITDALSPDYEVVGLDQRTGLAACEEIEADLTSRVSIDDALARIGKRHGKHIAAVIHLAAYYDFSGEAHPLYDRLNVDGTRRLLEALQSFTVERFVLASSMLVHAPAKPGCPLDEDAALAPAWAYPKSKARAEAAVREHRGDIPATILRIAGIYTDAGGVPTLTHQLARTYERRLKSRLFAGDPAHGQSMVHIADVTSAIARTVDRRRSLPECSAILIGEPEVMSYQAMQNQIAHELNGEDGTILRVPKAVAKTAAWIQGLLEPLVPDAIDHGQKPFIRPFMIDLSSDHYELDISRARTSLDWEPTHRLHESLPKLCEALQADPLLWYRNNGITPPTWLEQLEEPGKPSAHEREITYQSAYREAHRRSRWAHFVNLGIAVWLVSSPLTQGYEQTALLVSELASGVALAVFALLSLSWQLGAARWAQAAVGIWLMSAPLLLWAESATAYLNGTLVGALVFGLAAAVPPPPGVAPVAAIEGPTIPRGWSFSPSSWTQRLPIIALAVVGFLISRYLAAYQLGHIAGVWEPFFGGTLPDRNGTEQIITSQVSQAWPVPDAGLGALVYLLEIITGLIGSARRWRTMPWLVLLFGLMIVPLGAVSIFFIVIQPIVIGTWCTLCLVAAAAMLLQIPYSLDELVATGQFLLRRKRAGRSLLLVMLRGDTDEGGDEQHARMPDDEFDRNPLLVAHDCVTGGINLPWTLLASAAIGMFLMFTRLAVGTLPPLAHADHLLGALIVTVSVTALAEVARPVRFLNLLLGAALVAAPWMLDGGGIPSSLTTVGLGLILMALCLPRGTIRNSYGKLTARLV